MCAVLVVVKVVVGLFVVVVVVMVLWLEDAPSPLAEALPEAAEAADPPVTAAAKLKNGGGDGVAAEEEDGNGGLVVKAPIRPLALVCVPVVIIGDSSAMFPSIINVVNSSVFLFCTCTSLWASTGRLRSNFSAAVRAVRLRFIGIMIRIITILTIIIILIRR